MATFVVTWDIVVEADSPEEAAAVAKSIQIDPDSEANVFNVREISKIQVHEIDLDEL